MSTGKIITGILIGATVGAVLGILFAPDKGAETRRKIAKKTTDLTDAVKEKFNELGETITDKYENLKSKTKDIVQAGKDKVARTREEAESLAENI